MNTRLIATICRPQVAVSSGALKTQPILAVGMMALEKVVDPVKAVVNQWRREELLHGLEVMRQPFR